MAAMRGEPAVGLAHRAFRSNAQRLDRLRYKFDFEVPLMVVATDPVMTGFMNHYTYVFARVYNRLISVV